MPVTDLPTDILVLIFPYLSAPDFLAFTSSSKDFFSFRQEPAYWRGLTTRTFRIPPQPLLQADGARWQRLYQSLLTQSCVYTWGNNERGNLGHEIAHMSFHTQLDRRGGRRGPQRGFQRGTQHSPPRIEDRYRPNPDRYGWPTQIWDQNIVGVIADVQCGGWSTVLLNSLGQLFIVGALNGETFGQDDALELTQLLFPPGYPATAAGKYEPATAIRQYSVSRSHVLGLSDSGKMWEWSYIRKPGQLVKLISVDVIEGQVSGRGTVSRVVSGWAGNSAYIVGTGIVLFKSVPGYDETSETDGFLTESKIVPGTSYQRTQTQRQPESALDGRVGEVINHIILDNYIVFVTRSNKVFVYPADVDSSFSEPAELTTFSSASPDFNIEDIQGSFRRFGVFSKDGAVLLGNSALLEAFLQASRSPEPALPSALPQPEIIAALQKSSVISLAFGDYHFLALHTDGTISSHGNEPKGCGALGLGSQDLPTLRGASRPTGGWNRDRTLQIPPWSSSLSKGLRTIWFEPEKLHWLTDMLSDKAETDEGQGRVELMKRYLLEALHVWGEWFEQEGRAWHRGPPSHDPSSSHDDAAEADKGAYFALKIAAAGWHSAALVLVDKDKAERVRQKWLVKPGAAAPNENAGGEEAEGEEIASPSEQLVAGVRAVGSWLYEKGRMFLGLAQRDAVEGEERKKKEEEKPVERYVWAGQNLPRLRMANGEVMPGEQPLARWRDKEPPFMVDVREGS
ncbi:hypothetical protein MMC13_007518 [Lambiella insularis]|nr:hypothetical protein [Lambiella insularis]